MLWANHKSRSDQHGGRTSWAPLAMTLVSSMTFAGSVALAGSRPSLVAFKNWGLYNTQANSHISAAKAWNIEQGTKQVVVAVVDTGIDSNHRDLRSNIAYDQKRHFGFDFVTNQPDPIDDHGHGTHVAGIIGAAANPSTGTSGVNHHVSLMAVKYYSDRNSGALNLRNTVRALNYAIDHGARIINYSGGGPEFSEEEFMALKRAEEKGILVVAAAGNEAHNTDDRRYFYYPAAYRLKNILTVAATDMQNRLIPSSNWGDRSVHVAAPGENIYSTLPNNRYGYMSGTSQATAFVSGVAALLLAQNPKLKPADIIRIVERSCDSFPQLRGKVSSGGRVNAYRALLELRRHYFLIG